MSERLPPEGPTVDAVGMIRYPVGWTAPPRGYSKATRLLAGGLVVIFLGVVVVTTGVSLGTYCLTSDGGDQRELSGWLLSSERAPTTKLRP